MFAKVVELYRALGKPPIENASFQVEGDLPQGIRSLIDEVAQLPDHFGYFLGKEIVGGHVDIEFKLPESEHGRFHTGIAEFIKATPTLNKGDVPEQFYICDQDYYSGDTSSVPSAIQSLLELARFVKALTLLAADYGQGPNDVGQNRIFFILAADGKSPAKTLALTVRIEERLLGSSLPHVKLLEVMVSEAMKNEIHTEERRAIMRLAIADTLAIVEDKPDMFAHLVSHWKEVLSKYHHNVLAFVNQYSFEKVRKEIATAEIDHATKLSGVLGDIAGKLLALPISFAAIIALHNTEKTEEFWIIFAGLMVVTVIFAGVLINQWLQVKRLRGSFNIILGQYDESNFPKKLHAPIRTARENIGRQYRVLAGTFIAFGVLAFAPAGGAIYVWLSRLIQVLKISM